MLGQKSLTLFLSQWTGYALMMVSSIVVARTLGPHEVGRMGFYLSVIGLFFMVTSLGFSQAHQKRLAEGMDAGLCLGTFATILLVLNAAAFIIAATIYPFFSDVFAGEHSTTLFIMFLVYLSMMNLSQLFTYTFYGRQQFSKAAIVLTSARCVRLVSVLLLLLMKPSLLTMAVCLLFEGITFLIMGAWFSDLIKIIRRPTAESLKTYWTYTKPLAIISPISILTENADRVMLGSRFSITEVGYYNVAVNLFEALKSLPSSVITALFPRLTADYAAGGVAAKERFHSVHRKLLVPVSFLALLGSVWSHHIVTVLYGEAFAASAPALAFFFSLFWFISFASPYHYILYASDRHEIFLWISPIANSLYGVALWVLCGRNLGLGALGAALSFAVPHVVSFPLVLLNTIKHNKIGVPGRTIIHGIFAVVLLVCANWIMHEPMNLFARIGVTLLLMGVYAVGAFLLGHLSKSDVTYALHVLHPIRYWKNFRSELKG